MRKKRITNKWIQWNPFLPCQTYLSCTFHLTLKISISLEYTTLLLIDKNINIAMAAKQKKGGWTFKKKKLGGTYTAWAHRCYVKRYHRINIEHIEYEGQQRTDSWHGWREEKSIIKDINSIRINTEWVEKNQITQRKKNITIFRKRNLLHCMCYILD